MINTFPDRVRVVFAEYGQHVPHATDLATLLGTPLTVYVPVPDAVLSKRGRETMGHSEDLPQEMYARIKHAVARHLANGSRVNIQICFIEPTRSRNDIFVTCGDQGYGSVTLSPAGERSVFRGPQGPVFIPLGNGDSGLAAASRGCALAKRLGAPVLFWHTTWTKDGEQSTDARNHVCPGAQRVILEAEKLARGVGVDLRPTAIERSDMVVTGIIRASLRVGASLVVMAEGKDKLFGRYVDRVRARNCPTPLLTVTTEKP